MLKFNKNKMIILKNLEEYNKIKDKIAFVYYGNLNYDRIINTLDLGCWLKSDNKKINIYILNKNIHTVIPDEQLNESIDKIALILIEDIIKDVKINKDFKVMYDDYTNSCIEPSTKIYGRVERIWNETFNFSPYCFEIDNKTDLQINDNFIQLLKKFEYIGVKYAYKNGFFSSLNFDHIDNVYFRYEGYAIDFLKTTFNSVEELKNTLNSIYNNCQINLENLFLINIKDKIDIILKIFAPSINLNDLSIQDKDFIKKGICELEKKLGDFINLYRIKDNMTDSQIGTFYINLGQYCVIFKNYTLVISFASDE